MSSGGRVAEGGGGLPGASLCFGQGDGFGARDEVSPSADSALRHTTPTLRHPPEKRYR
jgi:hypothetical protein